MDVLVLLLQFALYVGVMGLIFDIHNALKGKR